MPGSPFKERENREVIEGIGSHKHVEMAAEEITFPVGVPAPVAVGLREKAVNFPTAGLWGIRPETD